MTYIPDATAVAAEYARREEKRRAETGLARESVWGEFYILGEDDGPEFEAIDVTLDLSKPGLIVMYHRDRSATIITMKPGWIAKFVPDDAGE